MEVTPVMDGAAQKQADGKPVWNVDGKEEAVDLGTLFETRSKYSTLSTNLDQLRPRAAKAAELEQKIAALGDYADPAKLKELRDETEKLRLKAAAVAAGTSDEAVSKLVQETYGRSLADKDAAIAARDSEISKRDETIKAKEQLLEERVIDVEVASGVASIKGFYNDAGVVAELKLLARHFFKLEDGVPVARSKDGNPVFGPDGKTPFTILDWLREKKHLQSANVNGGGARGNEGGANGGKTMPRTQFEALSAAEQSKRSIEGWTLTD